MRKLSLVLFPALLLLSACSTTPQSAAGEDPAYFESLSEEQAEAELSKVLKEIEELDDEIASAETRRDAARMRQTSEGASIAAEGTEAELDSLRVKKGGLINRQVQLEKRLRQFQSNKY